MLFTTLRTGLPVLRAPFMEVVCRMTSALSCARHAAAKGLKGLTNGSVLLLSALHEERCLSQKLCVWDEGTL